MSGLQGSTVYTIILPSLHLNLFSINVDFTEIEIDADGGFHVGDVRPLAEPANEARLPDSVVSNEDDLEDVVVRDLRTASFCRCHDCMGRGRGRGGGEQERDIIEGKKGEERKKDRVRVREGERKTESSKMFLRSFIKRVTIW